LRVFKEQERERAVIAGFVKKSIKSVSPFFLSHVKYLSSSSLYYNVLVYESAVWVLGNGNGNDCVFFKFFVPYLFCLRVLRAYLYFERDRSMRDSVSTMF